MTDQTAANKDLVREFHAGIWAGNHELFYDHVAGEYVGHDPALEDVVQGPVAFRELIAGRQAAMSDIDHTIEDIFGEGDRVVVRGRMTARHTDELLGIPPTDRDITVEETVIYRIADGQIAETWAAVDRLGMLQQLDAVELSAP